MNIPCLALVSTEASFSREKRGLSLLSFVSLWLNSSLLEWLVLDLRTGELRMKRSVVAWKFHEMKGIRVWKSEEGRQQPASCIKGSPGTCTVKRGRRRRDEARYLLNGKIQIPNKRGVLYVSDVQIVFRAWKMDFGWMPKTCACVCHKMASQKCFSSFVAEPSSFILWRFFMGTDTASSSAFDIRTVNLYLKYYVLKRWRAVLGGNPFGIRTLCGVTVLNSQASSTCMYWMDKTCQEKREQPILPAHIEEGYCIIIRESVLLHIRIFSVRKNALGIASWSAKVSMHVENNALEVKRCSFYYNT